MAICWATELVILTSIVLLFGRLKPRRILVDASSWLAAHASWMPPGRILVSSTARLLHVLEAVVAVPLGERGHTVIRVGMYHDNLCTSMLPLFCSVSLCLP